MRTLVSYVEAQIAIERAPKALNQRDRAGASDFAQHARLRHTPRPATHAQKNRVRRWAIRLCTTQAI